jgi:hypothetical protein
MKNFSVDFLDQVKSDIDGLREIQGDLQEAIERDLQKLDLVMQKKAQLQS